MRVDQALQVKAGDTVYAAIGGKKERNGILDPILLQLTVDKVTRTVPGIEAGAKPERFMFNCTVAAVLRGDSPLKELAIGSMEVEVSVAKAMAKAVTELRSERDRSKARTRAIDARIRELKSFGA